MLWWQGRWILMCGWWRLVQTRDQAKACMWRSVFLSSHLKKLIKIYVVRELDEDSLRRGSSLFKDLKI